MDVEGGIAREENYCLCSYCSVLLKGVLSETHMMASFVAAHDAVNRSCETDKCLVSFSLLLQQRKSCSSISKPLLDTNAQGNFTSSTVYKCYTSHYKNGEVF